MRHRWSPAGSKAALLAATASVILDQASKWLIVDHVLNPPSIISVTSFFNLRLGYNTGISFGMLSGDLSLPPAILGSLTLLVAVALLAWGMGQSDRLLSVSLGAIAGSAIGNTLDRFRQGAVVDFLDLHAYGWHWPTFNLADVVIVGGAAVVALRQPAGKSSS